MKKISKISNLRLMERNFEDSITYYLLISMACLNFTNRGRIVLLAWGLFALARYMLCNRLRFTIGSGIALFLSFAVLLPSCISLDAFDFVTAISSLNFFLTYYIGFNAYAVASDKKKFIQNTVFSLFIGFSVYILAIYFYNLYEGTFTPNSLHFVESFVDAGGRDVKDIWASDKLSPTFVAVLCSVAIGYSFYAFFCSTKKTLKLFSAFVLAVVFLMNFSTATRTPILLFVLVYAFMLVLMFIDSDRKKGFYIIAALLAFALLLFAFYTYDVFGLKTFIDESPLLDRFANEGIKTTRLEIAKAYFEHMLEYPWGGGNIADKVHITAHNFLQEGYDLYGVFAAIAILLITIVMIVNVIKLTIIKNKQPVDYLLLGMYVALLAQCMVEPVFESFPILFWCLLLVHGMATAYCKDREKPAESDQT